MVEANGTGEDGGQAAGVFLAEPPQQVQERVSAAGLFAFEVPGQHGDLVDEQHQWAVLGAGDGALQQIVESGVGADPLELERPGADRDLPTVDLLAQGVVDAAELGGESRDELGVGLPLGADRDDRQALQARGVRDESGQGRLAVPAVADESSATVGQAGQDFLLLAHAAHHVLGRDDAADHEGHGSDGPIHLAIVRRIRCTSR